MYDYPPRSIMPAWAENDEKSTLSIVRRAWFGLLALMPFPMMLAIHTNLDLSDALLGVRAGNRPSPLELLYNWAMVFAFYGGVAGFVLHAIWIDDRWWLPKMILIAGAWYLILYLFGKP